MLAIALNPGFVCILAALIVLALPRALRPFAIVGAGAAALWLMLDREFGEAAAAAQMGVPVVLLDLDALNRIFGIAMLLALIVIGACSGARRNRAEDAAILLLAGGAVSALFVGDLVSFAAAASLSGLAAAWLVFASPAPGAGRTGVRLLIWFGLEGLLILVGVAFQLSAGAASSMFAQLDVTRIGGAFIFTALMIRIGAPFAHVWLKDGAEHASPVGAAALCAFTSVLGVYALARLFASEPLLTPIGAAMVVLGVIFAMIEDDLRRATAAGLSAQIGICIMLVGVGSPLALAAAEGHAFTNILAFVALMLALGGVFGRLGSARISQIEGGARTMPISAALLAVAGLAAAGAPGFAVFVTATIGQEALAQWRLEGPWLVASAAPAGLLLALMLRPVLALYRAPPGAKPRNEAPFPLLLGLTLAVFFCLSIGLAPGWLYGLLPAQLTFQPYAVERVAATLELLGAAGVGYLALRALKLTPVERPLQVLDVDAFYRGPAAGAGRWCGVVLLRLYGAWRAAWDRFSVWAMATLAQAVRACDRPYRGGLWPTAQFAAVAAAVAITLIAQRL